MADVVTALDALIEGIERSAEFNSADQVAPEVVIWTDKEHRWRSILQRLRERLPLLTLGDYEPAERAGPAYWVRCMLARTLDDRLPEGQVPVLYLPGVSREELRAVEDCEKPLRPVVELQYRGVFWSHPNGRDWTVSAYLRNQQAGLGLDVTEDGETREAAQRALAKLLDEPVEGLRQAGPLTAADFDALLAPDEVRMLLRWLEEPATLHESLHDEEWEAFLSQCKKKYRFDPEVDGQIVAARRLGERSGAWAEVWERFAEAPARYPIVPGLLRQARPEEMFVTYRESWPQENDEAEARLRSELGKLAKATPAEAREQLQKLEDEHSERRGWIWAQLGGAPLARALGHLAKLGTLTKLQLAGASSMEIIDRYAGGGWKADWALLEALRSVDSNEDSTVVRGVADVLYRPWVEGGSIELQKAVGAGNLKETYPRKKEELPGEGVCFVFSDGLRLDLAHELAAKLELRSASAAVETALAALPTVTSTAKPAVAPIGGALTSGPALDPATADGGSRVTVAVLRKVLGEAGFQILKGDEVGDPSRRAWTELGDIDSFGHEYGLKLPHQLDRELSLLAERVVGLLEAGWAEVRIVTDHGWLLLPGGLPKAELPKHLSDAPKGRCARLKEESRTDAQIVPWHWDPDVRIALARGISCFVAGKEYEHGGLSPQECVSPTVVASRRETREETATLADVSWTRMRCRVQLEGSFAGCSVDVRSKPADSGSSLLEQVKWVDDDGRTSVIVPDPERAGEAAFVVVLGTDGRVATQRLTTVGGDG